MTLQLKIDTNALTALFPEGTEIRLKLQNAVIDQVVRRLAIKQVADIEARISTAVALEAQLHLQNVRDVKITGGNYSHPVRYTLGEAFKASVARAVDDAVRDAIQQELNKVREVQIEEISKRALGVLEHNLNAGLEQRIDKLIKTSFRRVVGDVM